MQNSNYVKKKMTKVFGSDYTDFGHLLLEKNLEVNAE